MGLSGALWCLIDKLDRWGISKPLEHYNLGEMKRSLDHIKTSLPCKEYSVINKPLSNIELDHVILDELQLIMRVTDHLTENIITEEMERDGESDMSKKGGDRKEIYLVALVSRINKIDIPFSFWEKKNADGKGSGSYECTSLTGFRKKKLMELIPAQR